jgi:2-dehydro-3-deoxyphosphogluconate aldolase/(4S)-4-hydroxy-2-oxoglutarate aldolase
MTREQTRASIAEIGIIPAVRLYTAEDALFAAQAISEGGIPIVEVTMTVPGAITVISELAKRNNGSLIVGAGTIFDVETAQQCLDAGAGFLTTPALDLEVLNFAVKKGIVVIPGALTPGEVTAAWKAKPDFVKIFPCAQVGGPGYIRALKAPFPHIPLIASGGVNQQNAEEFIRSGAVALGIGRDLIHPNAIKNREHGWICELARRYSVMFKHARRQIGE